MSVVQSNLSDSRYDGVDVVVAVTQASVNAGLTTLLQSHEGPPVAICYVYDEHDNLVPIDHGALVEKANGSDPFTVTPGADPATDQDLINLDAAGYAGGVLARIGIPALPDDKPLPPIVTLRPGTDAPVAFNLLCSQLQVTSLTYGRHGATWVDLSQPTAEGRCWYFSANVTLNTATVDPASPVPQPVRDRITALQKDLSNAFTLQKLFLDLDSAILLSEPAIEGLDDTSQVWGLINKYFLRRYFAELRQKGDPVLGWSFSATAPEPSTVAIGAVSRECVGLDNAAPTAENADATALLYLCSSSATAPQPVPFGWNWVELAEIDSFSGVQAVRRELIRDHLKRIVDADASALCIDPTIDLTHDHQTFHVSLGYAASSAPARFQVVDPPVTGPDGWNFLLTIDYNHPRHDNSRSEAAIEELWGDANYYMSGWLGVRDNQIRVQVHAQAELSFGHDELSVPYHDLPLGYYVDKTLTVDCDLQVDQNGRLGSEHRTDIRNDSQPLTFQHFKVAIDDMEDVRSWVENLRAELDSVLQSAFQGFADRFVAMIDDAHGWVFPGGDAFTFSHVGFSRHQDLVTQVTYVDPA